MVAESDLYRAEDDALFAEVLALLSDSSESDAAPVSALPACNASSSTSAGNAERRVAKKPYAIGSAARRKIALDALRVEERELSSQLERLRACSLSRGSPHQSMRERATAERLKRRRAEQECKALRAAVYQQTQFLRGLQGVFSVGPATPLTLNLCHHLHNFTRLPCDRSVRQDEYNALTKEERLHAAMELLCCETERIAITDSHIETDFVHESDESCAVTTKSVFVLGDGDVATVLRAACVAVRDIVIRCRAYKCVGVSGEIVDADALSERNLQYRVTSIRRNSAQDDEDFSVESRAVTMYKMLGDTGVVLWDFVDVDELHPLRETPDITRQSVGACLVRRERCPDGVVRTVFRELSTRRYEYRGRGSPSASVARYLESMRLSMRSNELLFRDIMMEHIAR